MLHLHPIPDQEMVATFLKTELASTRFEPTILTILERDGRDRNVIDNPDLSNARENQYRAQVLGEYRGYGRDQDVLCCRLPFSAIYLVPIECRDT